MLAQVFTHIAQTFAHKKSLKSVMSLCLGGRTVTDVAAGEGRQCPTLTEVGELASSANDRGFLLLFKVQIPSDSPLLGIKWTGAQ